MEEVTLFNCFKYKRNWLCIEMALNVFSNEIYWDKFVIPETGVSEANWQVPYLEQYLNENGTEKICELYDDPQTPVKPCRIAFFIYKTGDVLRTPYGDFSILHTDKIPKRLKRIIEFEKPD